MCLSVCVCSIVTLGQINGMPKETINHFIFFVETKTDLKISVKGENTARLILV